MTIHIHIDRIVLDGLSLSWKDASAVRLAVQRELASVLAAPGTPHASWRAANVARVNAAPVQIAARPAPQTVGRSVAQAIGGAIRS
jgi:hypothetical protein